MITFRLGRRSHAGALFLALWVGLQAFAAEGPAAFPSDGGFAARLMPFVEKNVIAGAVVLVADRDRVLDLEAVGYADATAKTPIKTTDLFYIASMTKTFTAATLMMLVDEGKVSLDDPVEKYLPEFKGQMVQEGKRPPHPPRHPITVREVMDHTAGLYKGQLRKETLEGYVRELAEQPLQFEPGTRFLYSAGPAVGGRIVEVVSGMPFTEFLQKRLLDGLGLKDTTFWPSAQQAARLALTHKLNPATGVLEPLHNVPPKPLDDVPPQVVSQFGGDITGGYKTHFGNPAGGLFSTALDVSRFCQMLLNRGVWQGKRYLSESAVKEIRTMQTGDLLVNGDEAYGLCCFVQKKVWPGGPSVGSYGHHGARKTQMWIDPQNGLVMVLMVQNWEFTGTQQKDLYSAYRQQAVAQYGKTNAKATNP